jgi:hypothetical protein
MTERRIDKTELVVVVAYFKVSTKHPLKYYKEGNIISISINGLPSKDETGISPI